MSAPGNVGSKSWAALILARKAQGHPVCLLAEQWAKEVQAAAVERKTA
jgi:hypothetical protein